jgi:hypothetical protein
MICRVRTHLKFIEVVMRLKVGMFRIKSSLRLLQISSLSLENLFLWTETQKEAICLRMRSIDSLA